MKFETSDTKELRDIGISSLLDLALRFPKSYDDLSIKDRPNEGINTVQIEIKFSKRSASMLSVIAFCITWNVEVRVVIFNAKPWHYSTFRSKKIIFINARSVYAYGSWQFINPKVVTKIGSILPHYKTSMQDSKLAKLIQKYVTHQNLSNEGLNENEINLLLKIHENNSESVNIISNLKQDKNAIDILKFIEIYNYMKKLNGKKINFKAEKFDVFDITIWISSLPFKPTNDQVNALQDIKNDFLKGEASKRVVMGDVGSGKTLVILGAALMVYPKTAILMAPTSILAEQIYSEAKRLLPEFMNVMLVKKGAKDSDFKGVNLIIGTHVLLYQSLPKVPLVMVDEQHRFGSNQRQKIDELTKSTLTKAHFLQFSATPIPRTLSLIRSELVSFSFLKEIPFKKNIHTILIQNDGFNSLMSHIKAQISAGKQAIIVYPLVEVSEVSNYQSLSEASSFWMSKFKNIFITHGKDKLKDEVLKDFKERGDILLTTTVVEVGISLPRLSTIVIVAAELLGLASLHQLRGRVGRNGGEGWCYLYTKLKNIPPRLKEFASTLDGFLVSEIDLRNRQAGDILDGRLQHGATFEYYDMEESITIEAKHRLSLFKKSNLSEQKS